MESDVPLISCPVRGVNCISDGCDGTLPLRYHPDDIEHEDGIARYRLVCCKGNSPYELPPSYTIEEIEELEKKYQATTGQSQKESLTTCGFTQNDRKVLHQIQQVAVYGNNPTDSQRAGNIRHRQVLYGAARYQPASGKNRGYSADRAATDAIKATEFKNKPGAYTIAERRSLAQAIRREYNKEKADSATSHTKM